MRKSEVKVGPVIKPMLWCERMPSTRRPSPTPSPAKKAGSNWAAGIAVISRSRPVPVSTVTGPVVAR
jgi:hypothetical protein